MKMIVCFSFQKSRKFKGCTWIGANDERKEKYQDIQYIVIIAHFQNFTNCTLTWFLHKIESYCLCDDAVAASYRTGIYSAIQLSPMIDKNDANTTLLY